MKHPVLMHRFVLGSMDNVVSSKNAQIILLSPHNYQLNVIIYIVWIMGRHVLLI